MAVPKRRAKGLKSEISRVKGCPNCQLPPPRHTAACPLGRPTTGDIWDTRCRCLTATLDYRWHLGCPLHAEEGAPDWWTT